MAGVQGFLEFLESSSNEDAEAPNAPQGEPDAEPLNRDDRPVSPPLDGRWTDRNRLPQPPVPVKDSVVEQLKERHLRRAEKVYVVYPGPWPGVYLSWPGVAEQTQAIPGTAQCSIKGGINVAIENLRQKLHRVPRVYA